MAKVTDPVCNMTIDSESAQYTSENGGTTYYFCSAGCKRAFDNNPADFVQKAQNEGSPTSQGGGSSS